MNREKGTNFGPSFRASFVCSVTPKDQHRKSVREAYVAEGGGGGQANGGLVRRARVPWESSTRTRKPSHRSSGMPRKLRAKEPSGSTSTRRDHVRREETTSVSLWPPRKPSPRTVTGWKPRRRRDGFRSAPVATGFGVVCTTGPQPAA